MRCVKCAGDTRVLTTYQNEDGRVRRRRHCLECDFRFTTREHPEVEGVELFAEHQGFVGRHRRVRLDCVRPDTGGLTGYSSGVII